MSRFIFAPQRRVFLSWETYPSPSREVCGMDLRIGGFVLPLATEFAQGALCHQIYKCRIVCIVRRRC